MKAAVVTAAGKTPIYADFNDPDPKQLQQDEQIVQVRAAALSNLTRGRASGSHYSSTGIFPAVAGTDGVGLTPDGGRVYFAMPEAPFGTLAELCPINARRCIPIPDTLDDITAAAIANPGMSAWASLVERAHLVPGETVMINGGTSTSGRIAIQLARHLGAAKIIATGRNAQELDQLKPLGADIVIPFALDPANPSGAADYQQALEQTFSEGIDVVVDYLWGESARTSIAALAATVEEKPVRFVQVGSASGQPSIDFPAAALRSAPITLMGSGIGSVSRKALVQSIAHIFSSVEPAGLRIDARAVPLSQVEEVWEKASGKPRVVFTIG